MGKFSFEFFHAVREISLEILAERVLDSFSDAPACLEDTNLSGGSVFLVVTYPCLNSILVEDPNDLKLEPESAGFPSGLGMNVVGEVETFGCDWKVT